MNVVSRRDLANVLAALPPVKALRDLEASPIIDGVAGIPASTLPANAEAALRVLDREGVVYSDREASADLIAGLETLFNRGLVVRQSYGRVVSYHLPEELVSPVEPGAWFLIGIDDRDPVCIGNAFGGARD